MQVAELRPLDIFDGLSDEQLGELVSSAREVRIEPGHDLFLEGQHADCWWVLLEGAIDLVRHVGREDSVVGRMDVPGRWAGGFRAWDERGVYLATGRGVIAGRVMCLPAERLRELANAWFPFGGHLIRGLNQTARRIEDAARQRGALVTLGTLAAGLAHEINNPASAAVRAVDALGAQCQTLLSSLGRLADEEITPAQFAALDALRLRVDPTGVSQDPLDRADREQSLLEWLSRHGVQHEWTIAPALATAGLETQWCDEVAGVLDGEALQSGLEWVASTLAATTLLAEMKDSTTRISELVAAIKSYSQMDRASMQRTALKDGLESTLVMLGHKLRDGGVTVVREYGDDVPEIDAYAGELNQVWTNLIDNAVDAMDGAGTLRVATRLDGEHVVVEVCDTGAGMPPEVQARAFEAFYTTKDVGHGTGLGLDIAWRIIVDRHSGEIAIDSEPGNTVIAVRIPVAAGR